MSDRVLLANKAQQSKRKLVDKWEPTIYTVITQNPQTHVYKVADKSRKMQIVYRNSMVDVGFLPVSEQVIGVLESCSSNVVNESHLPSIDSLSGLAVEASVDHTRSWVYVSLDA